MSLGEGRDSNEGNTLLSINPGRGGGKQLSGRTLEKWLFEYHIGHFLGKCTAINNGGNGVEIDDVTHQNPPNSH